MSPGWLALFVASVHVLLQAGVVRSKQLEISMSDEIDFVIGDIFAIVQRCNWDFFYLTVEIRWNETQFLLGWAVVEEQPFTLPKGVERLQRGQKGGLLSNELVGSLWKLTT